MRIQQQQQRVTDVVPSLTWGGGGDSHRVAAINLEESPNNSDKHDHEDSQVSLIGPFFFSFLVSYIFSIFKLLGSICLDKLSC